MYEPIAKNSITERVLFTGIAAAESTALEGQPSAAPESAPSLAPGDAMAVAGARTFRQPIRPNLYAVQ